VTPLFRLGDHGSAVAEIRGILTGQGLLNDAPSPSSRLVDPSGPRHFVRSARRRTVWVRECSRTNSQLPCTATTSPLCRPVCRTSATTPAWSTGSSVRTPTTRCAATSRSSVSVQTASVGRQRFDRSSYWVHVSPGDHRTRFAKRNTSADSAPSCPANGSSSTPAPGDRTRAPTRPQQRLKKRFCGTLPAGSKAE